MHDGIGFSADQDQTPVEGSAGAKFLRSVAYSVEEAVNDGWANEDSAHEIADSAVPIYTHELWLTFVDLGAYTEDVEEFGPLDDLNKAASVALYLIAERLVRALIEAESDDHSVKA